MKRFLKKLFIFLLLLVSIASIGSGVAWIYLQSPVDSNDTKEIVVEIQNGTGSNQIGRILKEKGLIRSTLMYKLYLKVNNIDDLKASKYTFNKSMSMDEIIKALQEGVVSNDDALKMTFKDGLRIPDYAKVISKELDEDYESVMAVMVDKEFMKELIEKYWFLTDSILDENIYYPLEGYLAPETYYFDKNSTTKIIIIRMLDQMKENLDKYKDIISKDPHYYITMASIVQLEGTTTENRKQIVGVLQNRLNAGMNLGSDVTTYYALQVSMKQDLSREQFDTENPYNTRGPNMIGKMPVGPICNPNMSSIEASASPTANDYYFFVADKNGEIYFTKTNAEHDQKVQELKDNGLWIEFSE